MFFLQYLRDTPIILVFILVYAWRGLYPGIGLSPVNELRHLSAATSTVFLILIAFTFWSQAGLQFSRLVFAFAWIFAPDPCSVRSLGCSGNYAQP